jgi:hypothetical protein
MSSNMANVPYRYFFALAIFVVSNKTRRSSNSCCSVLKLKKCFLKKIKNMSHFKRIVEIYSVCQCVNGQVVLGN